MLFLSAILPVPPIDTVLPFQDFQKSLFLSENERIPPGSDDTAGHPCKDVIVCVMIGVFTTLVERV